MKENLTELLQEALDGNLEQKINLCMSGKGLEAPNSCIYVNKDGILTIKETEEGELEFTYRFRGNFRLHKEIEAFKKFIDNLDDDIFINACEKFGKERLTELDNLLTAEENESIVYRHIKDFKECIKNAALHKALVILNNSGVEIPYYTTQGGITNINELD